MSTKVPVTDYAWPSLDIAREILAAIGAELMVAPSAHERDLIELAPQAAAILTCWAPMTKAVLNAATQCRTVARYGVGLNNIDADRAGELDLVVTNVPDHCIEEISDHALALLFSHARHIIPFARQTRSDGWDNTAFGSMRRLRGQTLGLVGYGQIARALADKANTLGIRVLAYSRGLSAPGTVGTQIGSATMVGSLEELLTASDVVSVHIPLTEHTQGLIGERELATMKDTAYLINTSRGPIVDTEALSRALRNGTLSGAALDVLADEPPDRDDPLRAIENLLLTPHAAFDSLESVAELQRNAARNVTDALTGTRPSYVVNPEVYDTIAFTDRARAIEVRA
ncbi:C-terminal binding protein [Rhodococcus sp. NPDC059968]|uniref:C-terminal binding protein n=1 Tax=Rhodococcus sp. NPDC059968 TaxID=3347017 RepID=UPI00366E8BA9